MSLKKYQKKRDLKKSKEPAAVVKKTKSKKLIFVVHKHAARALHYDLRLEMKGVLKSWAIPKGPSMNPSDKRLAVHVEDHPFKYKNFEGIIPEGYGAGAVIIWDRGTYTIDFAKKKSFVITLHGKKLKGTFSLVNFRGNNWLLIKKKDKYATTADVTKKDRSVSSKKRVETLKKQFEALKEKSKKKPAPKAKTRTRSKRPLSKTRPRKKRRTVRA